jgi:hypothetical protein
MKCPRPATAQLAGIGRLKGHRFTELRSPARIHRRWSNPRPISDTQESGPHGPLSPCSRAGAVNDGPLACKSVGAELA